MKKYEVSYTSGATGFGWDKEVDTIDEVMDKIDGLDHEYTAKVSVWDNIHEKFIFYKDCLEYDPKINLLAEIDRDLRTTTLHRKPVSEAKVGEIKKALKDLGVKGSIEVEEVSVGRIKVTVNGDYFGIYDTQKSTFVD